MNISPRLLAFLLVLAFLGQALPTLRWTAPTFDEVAHLPAGYQHVVTGRPLLNPEHPPLAKWLAGLPVALEVGSLERVVPTLEGVDEWKFGRKLLFESGHDPQRLMTLGRLPLLILAAGLGWVIFLWSSQLFGTAGGLFSLLLYAFCPPVLGHARLVTTDVPLSVFGVAACYVAWMQMRQSRFSGAVLTGVLLGCALSTKFTGVIFVMALTIATVLTLWSRSGELEHEEARVGKGVIKLLLVGASALAVIFVCYGRISLIPYLQGVQQIGFNHTQGYEFYLFGEYQTGGFPDYFFWAFVLKSAPLMLVSVMLLPFAYYLNRSRDFSRCYPFGEAFVWLPALAYFVFIASSAPDIGVRYIVPCYPFVCVGLGAVGAAFWARRGRIPLLAGAILVSILTAYKTWPDPISYFNGLYGCSGPLAIECLDDSNLDWGQDLGRVASALNALRRPGDEVVLLYFGSSSPSAYLKQWRSMREEEYLFPAPQLYAVSIHRFHRLRNKLGLPAGIDWYTRFKPVAAVGNTYLIYDFRAAVSQNR